ncbi:MAG TPA: hypothetical protein VNK95_09340 [Caldilineaceae bacterium]|nr:hypothetical protein [Caldilineaceae bacterium]
MELLDNTPGGYRFLTGIAPYSAGVVALPGFVIERRQLMNPLPYRAGFDAIARHLSALGRPKAALCAVELRIPAPLPFDGFASLNAGYRAILEDWGLLLGDRNPIARTNVAPAVAPPGEAVLYGFSYTTPVSRPSDPTFVVAGAGDLRDQADLRPEAIVRPGETGPDALRDKVETVLAVMDERLAGLGAAWAGVTAVNIYTVQPLSLFFESTLLPKVGSAAHHGVHWYYSRPPIAGLEYEMDLRRVAVDALLA